MCQRYTRLARRVRGTCGFVVSTWLNAVSMRSSPTAASISNAGMAVISSQDTR